LLPVAAAAFLVIGLQFAERFCPHGVSPNNFVPFLIYLQLTQGA
jgi:hypothetical protein